MELIIGFIVGVLFSILVVATLAYFRGAIERKMIVIEKTLANAGPRPQGFIIEPESEIEEIRQNIIDENRKKGKDTNISELL